MGHTSLNVTGDMVCTVAVASSKNLLSEDSTSDGDTDVSFNSSSVM